MRIFISFIFLIAFSNIYAADITTQLDVNPVLVNDTFRLTYTASGSVDDDPDFGPIEAMFDVLGTQQSSNMTMINGDIKRTKAWTLTLLSRTAGTFIIPKIAFGSDRAAEVKVIVKDAPVSNSATPNQNFILEMDSSQQTGFIQQQFIITVKLLIAQNINNYQFSDLTTSNPNTIIIPLGKNQQYKTYRGKKQYIIIEKKYALFPQKAETLKINPVIAAVTIAEQSSNPRFFDPFNSHTTSKRLYSKVIDLTIKDIPAQSTGRNWLPSTSVKLTEEWPENNKFFAGEPVTRTLGITAEGLTSAQLPEINQPSIDGLKQYPDKPETQEQESNDGLVAIRKQKLALIPTKAGSYTLPEISIPWWNTQTNKMETAHLPQRSFTVLPAVNNTTNFSSKPNSVLTPEINNMQEKVVESTNDTKPYNDSVWFWLSVFFFAAWLLTLTFWWRSKSKPILQENITVKSTPTISRCLKQLKTACEENNAQETKTALLEWAKLFFPDTRINNLSDIANQVSGPLKENIMSLSAYLYNPQTTEWQCDELYKRCKEVKIIDSDTKMKMNSAKLEAFNLNNS